MAEFLFQSGYVDWFGNEDLSVFQTSFDLDQFSEASIGNLNEGYGEFVRNAVKKRRSEFIAGRHCAHMALAGQNIFHGIIGVGTARQPLWPAGIVGSISHSHGYAVSVAAQASRYRAIGLDVEDVVTVETQARLRKSIVNNDELLLFSDSASPEKTFTLIFSVKESFFKAVYPFVGAYFGFDAISVLEIDWVAGKLLFTVHQNLAAEFSSGALFEARFRQIDERILTFFIAGRHETDNLPLKREG